MSEFKVQVHRIEIEEHPNADALELAVVGGYRSCVQKGLHTSGDLVVYIPEQAIVPDWLIEKMGLVGKLAGKDKNRVKAIKLRGILSQGLVLPLDKEEPWRDAGDTPIITNDTELMGVEEGEDVADFLGITKWEPPIPTNMSGQVQNMVGKTLKYDIENWKNYPEILQDGEEVVFTEKLHGTWSCFGLFMVDRVVTSKGFSSRGQAFTLGEENLNNLYVKMYNEIGRHVVDLAAQLTGCDFLYVLGEIFGRGVQDLHYGQDKPAFRVFDMYAGMGDSLELGRYLNYDDMKTIIELVNVKWAEKTGQRLGVELVPELYRGPYSQEVMEQYTDGKDTLSDSNVREGIVIKPVIERRDDEIGRVILKSVSGDYLTRKGDATEYN